MKWTIFLPREVKIEATRKYALATELLAAIKKGIIVEKSSNPLTFNTIQAGNRHLGNGELDAISLVTDCLDKSYKPYIILSDDKQAKSYSIKSRMKFVGILPLIAIGNKLKIISKAVALQYLAKLKQNNFQPKKVYERAFVYSLR